MVGASVVVVVVGGAVVVVVGAIVVVVLGTVDVVSAEASGSEPPPQAVANRATTMSSVVNRFKDTSELNTGFSAQKPSTASRNRAGWAERGREHAL